MKIGVLKRVLTVMAACLMLLAAVGCGGGNGGSSAPKAKTAPLGSTWEEVQKAYGEGETNKTKAFLSYDKKYTLYFDKKSGLVFKTQEKKVAFDKKDAMSYKAFLPSDAKEVKPDAKELPSWYKKGNHKFYFSKSLAAKLPVQKLKGKELSYNVVVSEIVAAGGKAEDNGIQVIWEFDGR